MKKFLSNLAFPLVLLAVAFGMGGCDSAEPTVQSPYTGKSVTGPTLMQEVLRAEADAKKLAEVEARADREIVRKATVAAQAKALQIAAAQDVSGAQAKRDLAVLQLETGSEVAAVAERAADRNAALTAALATIKEQADSAFAALDVKQQQQQAFVSAITNNPFVKSAAATVGIDTGGLGTLLGGAGAAFAIAAWRGKQQRADARAEGEAKANKARDLADVAFDEGVRRAAEIKGS